MSKHKKYHKIPYEKRVKLIQLVCEEFVACSTASRQLGISDSTARMIINKFQQTGNIFQKKQDKIKREHFEQFKQQAQLMEQRANNINQVNQNQYFLYFFSSQICYVNQTYPSVLFYA